MKRILLTLVSGLVFAQVNPPLISPTVTISGTVSVAGTGTAGTPAGGILTIQGVASMTPIQVSQATAGNLNATVVGTGTFLVQAAQSGVWAATVTQATAANLNATVIGAGTAGTANSGVVTIQGIASMTPVQVSQATASNLNAAIVGTGNAGTPTGGVLTIQGTESTSNILNWTNLVGIAVMDSQTLVATPLSAVGFALNVRGSGTAGSANAGVVTIQGIASMTPVQVSQATASNLNAAVVGTGTAGSPAGGILTIQGVTSMTPVQIQGSVAEGASGSPNPVVMGVLATGGLIRQVWSPTANSDANNGANMATGLPYVFNSSTYDKSRSASLGNYSTSLTLTSRNSIGTNLIEKGSRWTVVSTPAANSQASASIASEANVRHVLDTVCFSASSNAAVVATNGTVDIRDGATGAGTIISQFRVAIEVAAGAGVQIVSPYCVSGLNLVGTTNTAMTAEFSAGVTGATESITITGFNVN